MGSSSSLTPSMPIVRIGSPLRLLLPFILLLVLFHYLYSFSHEDIRSTTTTSLTTKISSVWNAPNEIIEPTTEELLEMLSERLGNETVQAPPPRRANAVIVMLARNSELNDVVSSMRQLEDRFNSKFNYPWVFLNDEPFTEEFIQRTSMIASSNTSYGVIPYDHWNQPGWIDEDKARQGRNKLVMQNIIYGGSVSYRNMCRFNSGFFYRHELLKPYRYYWRVEPNVKYFCDLDYDPFLMMQDEGKVYGFTISLYEWEQTIPSLWPTVREFMDLHPEYLAENNSLSFVSDNEGEKYNLCHFWSNFEIADMEFWRGEAYSAFFDYLESKGGFYYERWGDAPVHSIGAALFANTSQIHFFKDIGYRHDPFQHCPQDGLHEKGKCWCDPRDNFDFQPYSCINRWEELSSKYTRSQQ